MVILERYEEIAKGNEMSKNKTGPVPPVDGKVMAAWYDKLQAAVEQVGREMPPDVRTNFARMVKYEAFVPDWIAETGPYIQEP
jgi:hypothetical protein